MSDAHPTARLGHACGLSPAAQTPMTIESIPTLDMRDFDRDRARFVAAIGDAYGEWGFAALTHHGVDDALIERAYTAFKHFFALPEESKQRYYVPGTGGARGYTGFMVETAKDSQHPDLKEFWHMGRELPPDSPHRAVLADNLVVAEIPEMHQAALGLYQALDALGGRVLAGMAANLGLSDDYFDDKVDHGNSILRAIHYPPIVHGDVPNVRAGQHEDINLITLLIGSSAEGLQILSRKGDWVPVTAIPGAIVCNVGDMLQRLTNHVFRSTTHRVVNPPGDRAREPRYSIPFFLHPNPEFLIETLPGCISAERPNRYPDPITADGYLQQRLREIRLA